jgi:hypothetical protein
MVGSDANALGVKNVAGLRITPLAGDGRRSTASPDRSLRQSSAIACFRGHEPQIAPRMPNSHTSKQTVDIPSMTRSAVTGGDSKPPIVIPRKPVDLTRVNRDMLFDAPYEPISGK